MKRLLQIDIMEMDQNADPELQYVLRETTLNIASFK